MQYIGGLPLASIGIFWSFYLVFFLYHLRALDAKTWIVVVILRQVLARMSYRQKQVIKFYQFANGRGLNFLQ